MYALPQQTLDEALQDVQTALSVRAAASVLLSPDTGTEHLVLPDIRRRCPTTTRAATCSNHRALLAAPATNITRPRHMRSPGAARGTI